MAILDKPSSVGSASVSVSAPASSRLLVHRFLYQWQKEQRERKRNRKRCCHHSSDKSCSERTTSTTSTTATTSTGHYTDDDHDNNHSSFAAWKAFLAPQVNIVHPLVPCASSSNHSEVPLHTREASLSGLPASPQSPDSSTTSVLDMFQRQERHTSWGGALELGVVDEYQVIRHGVSHVAGFRGPVVQIFTCAPVPTTKKASDNGDTDDSYLDDTLQSSRLHIVSIETHLTQVPWQQRLLQQLPWHRKSWTCRRALRQAWWEEIWGDDMFGVPMDEYAVAEEAAFQKRLMESNILGLM
uniref:Uncharacterized protein n=1 Tax=Amphora coffeiformis TaxID=265554 RepID=A0A7S3L7X3_9STRA